MPGTHDWQLQSLKLANPKLLDGADLKFYEDEWLNDFLIDFFESKRDKHDSIIELSKWFDGKFEGAKIKDSDWVLFMSFQPEALLEFLMNYKNAIPAKHYWRFVQHLYMMTNFAHSEDTFVKLFLESDKPNRELIMNANERRYFSKLPEKLTIYRGCSKHEATSGNLRFSWTIKRKVAEFFAFDYRNSLIDGKYSRPKEHFTVIERTIDKSEAIAYFGGRKEAEIIYIPKK